METYRSNNVSFSQAMKLASSTYRSAGSSSHPIELSDDEDDENENLADRKRRLQDAKKKAKKAKVRSDAPKHFYLMSVSYPNRGDHPDIDHGLITKVEPFTTGSVEKQNNVTLIETSKRELRFTLKRFQPEKPKEQRLKMSKPTGIFVVNANPQEIVESLHGHGKQQQEQLTKWIDKHFIERNQLLVEVSREAYLRTMGARP